MESELRARIEQFQACIETRDPTLAAELLDVDFALVLVQPTPAVMPRTRWLEVLADYVIHAYDVEERVIDVDDDCAAVVQRVRMEATVSGQNRSGLFVITDVWRRRAGEWRVWRRHSTPLGAGPMPGAGDGSRSATSSS
jgi:hypothetical protein